MNKARGGDRIPAELLKIQKMMLLKWCTQYISKFGKLSRGHKTGKDQFYSNSKERQCQRMFKLLCNCAHFTCKQGYTPNPSSQPSTLCEQAGFQRGRGIREQTVNSHWIMKKAREFQISSASVSLTMLKPLTVYITMNCGKFLKRWEGQTTLRAF